MWLDQTRPEPWVQIWGSAKSAQTRTKPDPGQTSHSALYTKIHIESLDFDQESDVCPLIAERDNTQRQVKEMHFFPPYSNIQTWEIEPHHNVVTSPIMP